MLSPHSELIFAPEAARLLGIPLRQLEYWKAAGEGPRPLIIYSLEGQGSQTMFVREEVEEFAKDIEEINRINFLIKGETEKRHKKKIVFD